MPGLALISGPALEPISLTDAKGFCRIDVNDDDALVTDLIVAARRRCEDFRGRAFLTQTWDLLLDAFPRYAGSGEMIPPFPQTNISDAPIVLPLQPAQSVSSVKYTLADGVTVVTLPTSAYLVDVASRLAPRIMPVVGQVWPYDLLQPMNGVAVRFVAGFGDTAETVPAQLRLAIKELVAFWYQNRDAIGLLPDAVAQILMELPGGFTYA